MKNEFEVRSSDGVTTYVVEFLLESSQLHVYCSCPAGLLGKWCKHKMWLISGDISEVIGTPGMGDFDAVRNWLRNSELPRLLDEMRLAENKMHAVKAKLDNLKRALEKAVQKGVTI